MATIKDVQFAQLGETQKVKFPEYINPKETPGVVLYDPKNPPVKKEWYIFKLVDNSKSGGVYIPNIDDVVNPDTGVIERIRLLSGVSTIWQSQQKDLTEKYISQNMRSIVFPRGVKIRRVASHDKTMLDFMRLCNSNIGNQLRTGTSRFEFYEYDSAAAETEQFAREELEFKMESVARSAKESEMKKHASFLGIRLINDLGEPKSPDGIRREYARYAKTNPKYFEKTLGTDQIEIAWLVSRAIADSLIDIGTEPGKINWSNGGGMIGVYPQTENPKEYLINLAMTNSKEGLLFKEQLKKLGT